MRVLSELGVGETGCIMVEGYPLRYLARGSGWRFETLYTKEPETIEWIDAFSPGDLFWDIGANVGIYSIYAALRGVRVMAFEPHFANYFQLCANLILNPRASQVMPLCISFAADAKVDRLNLASVEFGASMSSFGRATDFRDRVFEPVFSQGMLGMGIDRFVEVFGVEIPNHVKIDVDGLEPAIVESASETFANPAVFSVSVELVESDSDQVALVAARMADAGLRLYSVRSNHEFATDDTRDVRNFLFVRAQSG